MQKKQCLCVHLQKNSTESLKNSTDVSAPSARFSNYGLHKDHLGVRLVIRLFGCHNAENDQIHRKMVVDCPLVITPGKRNEWSSQPFV